MKQTPGTAPASGHPRQSPRETPAPTTEALRFRAEPRAGDEAAVHRLVLQTGFFNAEEAQVARELVQEWQARGVASGYAFLLADAGGALAGYVCYGAIPGTEASWDLYWIVVAPEQQGQGLGRELLRRCESAIAAAGGKRVYIETASRPQYDATRAFYLRNGYRQEALLEDYYTPGDGKVLFVKVLG